MTEEDASNEAMAAMGLPVNFAAPAFPKEKSAGKAVRPPPPGPSNRGGRGRDGGWGGRGRGRGRGAIQQGGRSTPYQSAPAPAPRGRGFIRGGHQSEQRSSRGSSYSSNRGRGGHHIPSTRCGPLPPLEEITPLFRPSFIEDPWAHLS